MEKTNTLKQLLIYESASHSPYRNLAAEEYLTRTLPANTAIMFLWQNENTVVIGKNQNCYAECRVAELEACGGHLARRPSGGGAVRHDMGNLCFSFIAGEEDYNVTRQLSVISAACRAFGIDAVPSGRETNVAHEPLVGSFRVSGHRVRPLEATDLPEDVPLVLLQLHG